MNNALPCRKRLGLVLAVLLFAAAGLAAEEPVKIAFLKIENLSMDPRYDYLEGILSGTLLFDLANAENLVIVDRASLDAILKEQKLAMSDLVSADKAVRVGRLLNAKYLLKGQYVFLGTEVRVTISLVEVETGKTLPFHESGSTENLVHTLAERIIERLTGKAVKLASDEHDRSIISLKDEKPGSIALYCIIIEAEIFLDGEFVGFTAKGGNATTPYDIPNVRPGKHTLRIHLNGFGVVKEPEIVCQDWQETVEVKPGQRLVVRSNARHLSYVLYDLQKLANESKTIQGDAINKPYQKELTLPFTDREGKKVDVVFRVNLSFTAAKAEFKGEIVYNGKVTSINKSIPSEKREEFELDVEKVKLKMQIEYHAGQRCYISYHMFRNDFSQDECMKNK